MVPLSVSILPVVLMRRDMNWGQMIIYDVPLFLMATASVGAFYIVSQKELYSNWTAPSNTCPCSWAWASACRSTIRSPLSKP